MQRYDIHLYEKCQLSVKIREKRPIKDINAAKCVIDYSPSNTPPQSAQHNPNSFENFLCFSQARPLVKMLAGWSLVDT